MPSTILQTFLLLAVLVKLQSYELDCPIYLQRKIRENVHCNGSDRYLCLFDDNTKHNRESCGNKPEFEIPGYKFIIVGTLQGVPCGSDRYQPFRFWTNASSECVFTTSKCNGIGQLMYKKGTSTEDIACRCDYTNGYDFVIKPRKPCMCSPEKEDCICYLKKCSVGQILTPDYECVAPTTQWNASFKCRLKDNVETIDDEIQTVTIDDYGPTTTDRIYVLFIIVIGVILIVMMTIVLVRYYPRNKSLAEEDSWFNTEIINNILNKEKLDWKEKTDKFVNTRATKVILDRIENNNCILISGPPGCGKTANAYCAAFILEKTFKFMVLSVSAVDLHKYVSSSINQVFIIDDVFGKYCCDTDFSLICASLKAVLDNHTNTKIIMTCRTQIYYLTQNQLALENLSFVHCDLLLDELQLTVNERREIGESYITNGVISELNDDMLLLYSFFPSLCTIFAESKERDIYFTYPFSYIAYEVNNIKLKSNETYLVLALLVVFDNLVDEMVLDNHYLKTDVMLKDICTESGILQTPSKGLIISTMRSLDGTFVRKCDHRFSFMHKYMFNMMVVCIGRHFIKSILKYGSMEFVQNSIQLDCFQENADSFMINVIPDLYNEYFTRLISDINRGNVSTIFANKQMSSGQFRMKMIPHFEKHLKAKYIIDAKDKSTVIHKVSSSGYTDLLAYFVKNDMPNINKQDKDGRTALQLAVLNRHQHIAEILLRQHADVHLGNNDGRSVIHIACNNGDLHMVELLLKHKAHTNEKDKHDLTPLHLASIRGDIEVVKLLAQKKAKMNEIDDIGRTPLYLACEMNRIDTVKFLLQNKTGNTLHIEEKYKGFTPLHIACMKEHTTIVETLLQYGANVNQPATDNKVPLKIAKETGNEKLINLLKNHKGTCSAPK